MTEYVKIQNGHHISEITRETWETDLAKQTEKLKEGLGFMTPQHRRVHHFVVAALPRIGEPVSPQHVARELDLPLDQVNAILQDLEKHKTFLFRNRRGDVSWAYPVTVDFTPQPAAFSTGETIFSA